MLSKRDESVLLFYKRGYIIDDNGNVFNSGGRKLNPYNDGKGYLNLSLKVEGKVYKAPIHRVQAYKKYSDKIFNKDLVVRHLDSNSLNNSVENISLGTQSENMYDKPKHSRSFRHQEKEILIDLKVMSIKEVMIKYNVKCKQTIHNIIKRNYVKI